MIEIAKTSPTREAIRLTQLWQKFGPNAYPLDIRQLIDGIISDSGFCDELNVVSRQFDSFEGALVRTSGTRKWTILLNDRADNIRRMRFTFAHELGHFMCHRELQEKFEDSSETLNDFNSEIELEANKFASWLLMPANLVRDGFAGRHWNTETLCDVGSAFECSLQAAALRFTHLSEKKIAFVVSRDGIILWSCKSKNAPYMRSFRFGDELPEKSQAFISFQKQDASRDVCNSVDAWAENATAIESQYLDGSGNGFQYTCIEFDC